VVVVALAGVAVVEVAVGVVEDEEEEEEEERRGQCLGVIVDCDSDSDRRQDVPAPATGTYSAGRIDGSSQLAAAIIDLIRGDNEVVHNANVTASSRNASRRRPNQNKLRSMRVLLYRLASDGTFEKRFGERRFAEAYREVYRMAFSRGWRKRRRHQQQQQQQAGQQEVQAVFGSKSKQPIRVLIEVDGLPLSILLHPHDMPARVAMRVCDERRIPQGQCEQLKAHLTERQMEFE
jgi:hypothetical protein